MARVAGGAVEQMWYIGQAARHKLHAAGITLLALLLAADPDSLPKGVLRQRAPMLAIMEANRAGHCVRPPETAPAVCKTELFVDCEFFSSINI